MCLRNLEFCITPPLLVSISPRRTYTRRRHYSETLPMASPTSHPVSSPPSRLNPEQQRVAEHFHGRALVIAGPGSGKTSTITARVGQLLLKSAPPQAILCLTFNNIPRRGHSITEDDPSSQERPTAPPEVVSSYVPANLALPTRRIGRLYQPPADMIARPYRICPWACKIVNNLVLRIVTPTSDGRCTFVGACPAVSVPKSG